jgi:hypothetical protein
MSKRKSGNPQCQLCNLFMSWQDVRRAFVWTPFAHGFQYEMPDEEFAHERCWTEATERQRNYILRSAWIPVTHYGRLATA